MEAGRAHVRGRDASAGEDDDAAGGVSDEATKLGRPVDRAPRAAAREHDGHPEIDQRVEAASLIGELVEGAMEAHGHRSCRSDQIGHHVTVDHTGRRQRSDDHARSASRFRGLDVGEHDGRLVGVVDEAADARPDEDVDGYGDSRQRPRDQADRRRHRPVVKRAAELDPVHAGLGGGKRAAERLDGSLDEKRGRRRHDAMILSHRLASPAGRRPAAR